MAPSSFCSDRGRVFLAVSLLPEHLNSPNLLHKVFPTLDDDDDDDDLICSQPSCRSCCCAAVLYPAWFRCCCASLTRRLWRRHVCWRSATWAAWRWLRRPAQCGGGRRRWGPASPSFTAWRRPGLAASPPPSQSWACASGRRATVPSAWRSSSAAPPLSGACTGSNGAPHPDGSTAPTCARWWAAAGGTSHTAGASRLACSTRSSDGQEQLGGISVVTAGSTATGCDERQCSIKLSSFCLQLKLQVKTHQLQSVRGFLY